MNNSNNEMLAHFAKIQQANREGYAGILPSGGLVDRREQPEAYPVAANSMFNVTEPRCISCGSITPISSLEKSLCNECREK